MRGIFASPPPPPPSALDRARALAIDAAMSFVASSSSARALRLVVTAYGALLCASVFSARAAFGARKIHDAARATAHLALSGERRRSRRSRDGVDPARVREIETATRKTIVFIRHGESAWNEIFNRKFDATFPGRLFGGLARELMRVFTCDSVFLDSPLSEVGLAQARALRERFERDAELRRRGEGEPDATMDCVLGVRGKCVIASSNLRRAVHTTVHALWCRLANGGASERVVIHSALQEVARNVDTYALASKKGELVPTPTLAKELGVAAIDARALFDASRNAGQKPIGRAASDSMREFVAWAMNQDADVVVAGGHSIWFREFFKTYLPFDSECPGKKKKIVNCGVVAFDLTFGVHPAHGEMYAVENVREIYGGFSK